MIAKISTLCQLSTFLVVFVDKVDNDFYHCVLFFGATFCYHKSKGYQSIVSNTLSPVFIIKDTVTVEKP